VGCGNWRTVRHGRAGQVFYHLMRRGEPMALNKRVAIYAGTFDPMTRGHEDLVRRAACLFDRVIVAIAQNQPKRPFFSLAERVEMAQEVLAPYPNAEVCGFDGLLMDFLHAKGAKVIIREGCARYRILTTSFRWRG
jgi:cytidyltransferase-like protein